MTKKVANKGSLKDRILVQALEMFNEKGIEYVGMRELAASLGIKLGNITYYFPTKEELIFQLAVELSESNSKILHTGEGLTMTAYLEMMRNHFANQYRYRCLFISFVHLMKQYDKISAHYRMVEANRRQMSQKNIENLISNNYLRQLTAGEFDALCSNIMLISRFWLSEAAISFSHLQPEEQIKYYLKVLAQLLICYGTVEGKALIASFDPGLVPAIH